MSVITTNAFYDLVTVRSGDTWETVHTPVRLSAIALASIAEYGADRRWKLTEYDEVGLRQMVRGETWLLDLYDDDPHFKYRWAEFCSQINYALDVISEALSTIDAPQ